MSRKLLLTWTVVLAGVAGCAGEGELPGSVGGLSECPNSPSLLQVAPACNTVPNNAPAVPFKPGTAGTLPSPAGGEILDGMYWTTATAGWGGVPAAGRRATIVVQNNGTRFLFNGEVLDADGATVASSYRVTTTAKITGTQVQFNIDCTSIDPSPVPPSLNFTGGGAQLQLMLIDGGNVTVTSYTRTGCP